MRSLFAFAAAGAVLLACSNNDQATGPDPRNCTKGSISVPDTHTGHLGTASCLRWDWNYSEDSVYYDSYDLTLSKGTAYLFNMQGTAPASFDGTLELVQTDLNTGDVRLYAISDDEGLDGGSQFYFVAPVGGAYSLRVSGYDKSDTATYVLKSRSCGNGIAPIVDSLIGSTQTVATTDCVVESPQFNNSGDSLNVRLYTVTMAPNESKLITVSSAAFNPGFQIFGPGFGTSCDYGYEGCGGGTANSGGGGGGGIVVSGSVAHGGIGGTAQLFITADGRYQCRLGFCGYTNFPGQYTLAVGGDLFGNVGTFTLTVQSNPSLDIVGMVSKPKGVVPVFNPVLEHLFKKPALRNVRSRRAAQH